MSQPGKVNQAPVALADAIGPEAKVPRNAINQPSFHPPGSKFQFDPKLFLGESSKDSLIQIIRNSFPCCKLYLHRNTKKLFQLRCQHYPTQHSSTSKQFTEDKFSKTNCKVETVKHQRYKKNDAFTRMDNPRMTSAPPKRAVKKSLPTIDRRNKNQPMSISQNKRCLSVRAEEASNRCHMSISVFMHHIAKTWHLSVESNFHHSFHTPLTEQSSILSVNDLNKDQISTLRLLHGSGVPPNVIAHAMSQSVLSQSGKKGIFLSQTISNISTREQRAIQTLQGMKAEWSEAEKVLHSLDR